MLLIDADIVVYRIGFASQEDPVEFALHSVDAFVFDVLLRYPETDYTLYLTGKGNYREHLAQTAKYKGNRDGKEKPVHYQAIRDHLADQWRAVVIDGMEADDAIAMKHTELGHSSIICSIDKDFDQLPGKHYNFVKQVEYEVGEEQATRFLYEQILTGDTADNIIGLRGIGPVKARKILEDCETEYEMYVACVKAYEKLDESPHPTMRVVENANLLYLLRKEGEHWIAPSQK